MQTNYLFAIIFLRSKQSSFSTYLLTESKLTSSRSLFGNGIRVPFEQHCHALSTGGAGRYQTELTVFAHQSVGLWGNAIIECCFPNHKGKEGGDNSPCACKAGHRSPRTDDQSRAILPSCSTCSYRACRPFRSVRGSSCRSSPSRVPSGWR